MTFNDQLGFVVGELYRGGYFCQLEKMSRVIFLINVKEESMNHQERESSGPFPIKKSRISDFYNKKVVPQTTGLSRLGFGTRKHRRGDL